MNTCLSVWNSVTDWSERMGEIGYVKNVGGPLECQVALLRSAQFDVVGQIEVGGYATVGRDNNNTKSRVLVLMDVV